jgi:hypothetical protein
MQERRLLRSCGARNDTYGYALHDTTQWNISQSISCLSLACRKTQHTLWPYFPTHSEHTPKKSRLIFLYYCEILEYLSPIYTY